MSRSREDVTTETVSLRQLSPGQVAEIVSPGAIRGEHAPAEDALCGPAGLTYRVRGGVIVDFDFRRERASGETSRGWTVGVTREW